MNIRATHPGNLVGARAKRLRAVLVTGREAVRALLDRSDRGEIALPPADRQRLLDWLIDTDSDVSNEGML